MNDRKFFKDKVIIITGASSGIGREAAMTFARSGARVVIASRNEVKLTALQNEILSNGGQALMVRTDITVFDDVQRLIKATIEKWGKIDIVIANAGRYFQDYTQEISMQSYEQSLFVNFFGTLKVIKGALPQMRIQKSGHIVIVNSLDSKKGIIGDGPYVAAKAALDGFGDVLRQELKPENIHVTSIYPARVDTPMIEHLSVPWISPKIPPQKVVNAMIKGIKRNKSKVTVPSLLFVIGLLNHLSPRLADWSYRLFKIEGERITG